MRKVTIHKFYVFFLVLFTFSAYHANAQEVAINEIMSSNNSTIEDEDGDASDWIEIYNYGATPVNLEDFGLTDDPATLYKWVFPALTIQPDEYILVWASDKDRATEGQPLHTNFKISSGGENILLTNTQGNLVDEVPPIDLDSDVSYGRQPDGTGSWLFFYTSTPEASNTGTGLSELLTPPSFSQPSGLYTESFDLTISHDNPNAEIVYTLDGSEPKLDNLTGTEFNYKNDYPYDVGESPGPLLTDSYTSNTYTSPINVHDRSAEPDQLASKNSRQHEQYVPINPVRKATVVKARAYVDGVPSKTVSETFFVWSEGNPYDIPVISIQIQENYMFGYNEGIYTAGVDFDTWRAENPDNNQAYRPDWNNYWRRGKDWEYPVNIEFFEPNGNALNSVMSQNGGLRIHGNNSRAYGIKSIRFYARSKYDNSGNFEFDLFDNQIPGATVPNNNEFKRILLRGNGSGGPISYDAVFSGVMEPIYNGVARTKLAIHFINGEYWGLTQIRDRIDDHHFALNFGLDDDNVVIVECKGVNCDLDEGEDSDYSSYIAMRNFIIDNDMGDQAQFDQAASLLDMGSFIDHIVMEIYAENDSYERSYWKVRTPENDNFGDGKWRLTVQDFEASLKSDTNWLEFMSDTNTAENNVLFGNLLANEGFKIQFINRFADIMNTVFTPDYFNNVVNSTFDEVSPYLAEDANRFPKDNFYDPSEKTNLINWETTRPTIQRNQIKEHFGIAEVIDLTLNVSNVEAGSITINSIDVKSSTPGITENPYPWTGKYFHGIPITLEAVALPGYAFSHWSGDVSGTDPIIEVTPTSDMQIQANFDFVSNPEQVVYFWLMDGEIPNNTPLESMDDTYASNDLSASIIYSSCLEGYPFTSDDPNWRKASFERKNAPTPLNYFPEANNEEPYSSDIMKGVQVKQPFKFGSLENTLEFQVPTTDYENIKFSFAVKSTGAAAETLLIDYWDGSQWSTDNLDNPSETITDSYQIMEFDFSNVSVANENPDFKIRMRFDGTDMFVDEGDEVIMNNIALTGISTLDTKNFDQLSDIKVYPNPVSNLVKVEAKSSVDKIILYSMYGQMVNQYFPKTSAYEINMEAFSTGIYLMKVISGNSAKTIKVIKK